MFALQLCLPGCPQFFVATLFNIPLETFRVHFNRAIDIVMDLEPQLVQFPNDPDTASRCAESFVAARGGKPAFKNIALALDGTFVFTRAFGADKTVYFGYKHVVPTLLLLVACDGDLRVRWYDIQTPGYGGDQGSLNMTAFGYNIMTPAVANAVREVFPESREAVRAAASTSLGSESTPSGPTPVKSKPQIHNHEASRITEGAASEINPLLPPGFAVIADNGFADTDLVLTPCDKNIWVEFEKLQRTLKRPQDREVFLDRVALVDFLISSHRIHVERCIGVLVNSFKILRHSTYGPRRTRRLAQCALVIHNHRVNCRTPHDRPFQDHVAEDDYEAMLVATNHVMAGLNIAGADREVLLDFQRRHRTLHAGEESTEGIDPELNSESARKTLNFLRHAWRASRDHGRRHLESLVWRDTEPGTGDRLLLSTLARGAYRKEISRSKEYRERIRCLDERVAAKTSLKRFPIPLLTIPTNSSGLDRKKSIVFAAFKVPALNFYLYGHVQVSSAIKRLGELGMDVRAKRPRENDTLESARTRTMITE